jgi:hypothetical protein
VFPVHFFVPGAHIVLHWWLLLSHEATIPEGALQSLSVQQALLGMQVLLHSRVPDTQR